MAENWLQHTFQRTRWQPQNQAVTLGALGVIIALILGALYLSQVVSFATTNREIEDLLVLRNDLEQTNEQLRTEIANFKTVPRLLARAQELGFRDAQQGDIEYMVIEAYNPNRADTVVPDVIEEPEIVIYDETFQGWLQEQWDSLSSQFENFGE